MLALAPTTAVATQDPHHTSLSLPQYHYGAPIPVECLNRSSETGEHIELDESTHELQWIPFPTCNETGRPLEFGYGVEGEVECTIAAVDDPLYHLLEFYLHADAPLACRIPARPLAHTPEGHKRRKEEYVPLVFALAGTLQLSHVHVGTRLNVLLHSVPKHHIHKKDSGVIDCATAYSTSPLNLVDSTAPGEDGSGKGALGGSSSTRLIINDPLPFKLSVRWFPTPALPRVEGKVEWSGMGGHVYASTIFYSLVSFLAGGLVAAVYFFGSVLPARLMRQGGRLGGGISVGSGGGYGGGGGGGVGNGWGYYNNSHAASTSSASSSSIYHQKRAVD